MAGNQIIVDVAGLVARPGRRGSSREGDAISYPNFQVTRGTRTLVSGPNASGKTVLLDILSGFVRPCGGAATLRLSMPPTAPHPRLFRHGLGRSFQAPRLVPRFSVRDYVRTAEKRGLGSEWMHRILEGADVPTSRRIGELSYGQQRLVGVAIALAMGHVCCLLDEPFAGVHPSVRSVIAEALADLSTKVGGTFVVVEHIAEHMHAFEQHISFARESAV